MATEITRQTFTVYSITEVPPCFLIKALMLQNLNQSDALNVNDKKESSQQTDPLVFHEVGCNSRSSLDKETQTTTESIKVANYNEQEIAQFLQKNTPYMIKCLANNLNCQTFSDYKIFDNKKSDIIKLYSLKSSDNVVEKMSCTGLSWNATGSIIGVIYGSLEHEGWCSHTSRIACWNIFRRNFEPSKPHNCYETSTCISCIEFHPVKPAIFATGNYNGQISLWNIAQEDDPEVAKTDAHDKCHNDVITCLAWIKEDGILDRFLLCSSSLDGKILIWKFSEHKRQLQIIKGYIILSEDLPRSVFTRKQFNGELGVTSMSFTKDNLTFIATVEGGVIVKCSLESNKITGHVLDGISLYSPVIVAILSPFPYLSQVTCSPFLDLFAVCGPYNGMHIYNSKKIDDEPIAMFNINSIAGLSWHSLNSDIIGILSTGGLQLFNLKAATILQENYLKESGNKMLTIKFNQKDSKILAIGDSSGEVFIWQLTADLQSS